jgi:4-amino-4-deoxy-L-arabinose transferase-like glycosyltransferase
LHSLDAILNSSVKSINYALLFFGCVIFHILGTWSLPLIDRDEPRFAEASREMIERGNYVVPYFNNQLRLDKPPLTYWAQVASYHVFGENDFAARLPSAIAAAATAVIIFIWGRRLGGEKLGWLAAVIFTLSLQTFVHAKAAVADMWLVLFVTIAHWSGYELIHRTANPQYSTADSEELNRRSNIKPEISIWWSIFYLSLAFGFLAKGPIAWTPLLTAGVVIVHTRDWSLLRCFKFVRGFLLSLVVVALWGIPALIQTHGEFFTVGIGRHVVTRSFTTLEGHGASSLGMYVLLLPFYFVTVFISFFPWSIKLPSVIRRLCGNTKPGPSGVPNGTPIDRYLVSGTAVIFIIFTFVSTKLPHYTLPAFPLLALLVAQHWHEKAGDERRRSGFGRVAIATAVAWIAIALAVPPIVARFFPARQLFQVSRGLLQPNMQFAAVEFQEPSLVWYFRSRIRGFLTPLNKRRAANFMTAPASRFIILPTPLAKQLFTNPPESWRFVSITGFNIVKGRRVDLTLVLKEDKLR